MLCQFLAVQQSESVIRIHISTLLKFIFNLFYFFIIFFNVAAISSILGKDLFFKLIYLFLAVLGLCCCTRAFSSCGERGLLFVVVRRLLLAVASLVAEHGLQARGLQQLWCMGFSSCGLWALERRLGSCGTRAQLLCSMWDLPRPGLKPMSPALAGEFLTTVPPGKAPTLFLYFLPIQVTTEH